MTYSFIRAAIGTAFYARAHILNISCVSIIFTAAVSLSSASWAQQTIDQVEGRFDEARTPLSQPGRSIPKFDPLNPPPAAAEIQFQLNRVVISGNTVISDQVLQSLYAGLLGKRVAVSQIFGLANQITSLYGQHGYPLTRAVVPAQEIDGSGTIRLQVVEGFIDEVIVEGDAKTNSLIRHHSEAITAERPISNKTLERNLLLADDLPGISVQSVLKRSDDTFGGTTVVLDTKEDRPFEYRFTLDNRGSDAVGPYQLDFSVTANNLIHQNSSTQLRLVNASFNRELLFATLEHKAVISPRGTTLSFGLKASRSEPGTLIFTDIELETESTTAFIELRHPLIRSRNRNLEIYGLFEAKNSETVSLGTSLSRDRLRSLRFGLDFDSTDQRGGLNAISFEVSKGLTGFGANANSDPLNSREFGRVDYTKATLDISRTQQLGFFNGDLAAWSVFGKAQAQFTGDALMSSEECSIGGSDYGRAFDSSTLSGDRCYAASLEVRYQSKWTGPADALQLYGFYDVGSISNLDTDTTSDSVSLASAGLGARFSFLNRYSGTVEIAKQLRNSGGGIDNDPRIFFSLSGEF